jgi:predicted nucleic acid-binding Zn ribbon protein
MTHGIPRLHPRHAACLVCGEPLPEGRRADLAYCSVRCRVSAYRQNRAVTAPTHRGAANPRPVATASTSPERDEP